MSHTEKHTKYQLLDFVVIRYERAFRKDLQMKKTNSVILLVVANLGLLSLFSCGPRHHDRRPFATYRYEQNEGHRFGGGGCSRSRHRDSSQGSETFQMVYQPNYFMQNLEVHQNISFQEALYMLDPSAKELEQKLKGI